MSELARRRLRRRRLARLHRRILIGVPLLVSAIIVGLGAREVMWPTNHGRSCGPREQAYEIAKSVQIFELVTHRPLQHLDELVHPPSPHKPIMEQLPRAPWGRVYTFVRPGLRNTDGFDVVSAGEDGVFFTGDDHGNFVEDELGAR